MLRPDFVSVECFCNSNLVLKAVGMLFSFPNIGRELVEINRLTVLADLKRLLY